MAQLTRTAGFGVALLVALHAATLGTVICRHKAAEMNCECPRHQEKVPERPTLRAESCCQIRTASAEPTPAVVKGTAPSVSKHSLEVWSAPKLFHALGLEGVASPFAARQQAPPSTPLYLTIRTLLI